MQDQSRADDLIVQLAEDYQKMIDSAGSALSVRRKKLKVLQSLTKKGKKKKAEDVMEEIDKCQKEFDKLSQAVRKGRRRMKQIFKNLSGEFLRRPQ